ncbi:MAG: sensor histidine kinase [Peptostreptococcaceae bacterium]|nr:sensor histidine kinase [Peptostreptococcaceae bacterium]
MKKYFLYASLIALTGEIYFYPFSFNLRFSAGIITLNAIILLKDNINYSVLTLLSGSFAFIFRSFLNILFGKPILESLASNFPSFYYYLFFALLLYVFDLRDKDKFQKYKFLPMIFSLSFIDMFSNIIEASSRNTLSPKMVRFIVLVAFIRAFIGFFIYYIYKKREILILSEEHEKRYLQLNIMVSNIESELFYLKKSMDDIESVMSKSYSLYEKNKENKELKEEILDISREIHEIKKDYSRVVKGFENFLSSFENKEFMYLSKTIDIIKANTLKYLKESKKDINIKYYMDKDFKIKSYYNIFTILNNLIINAIDACSNFSKITVFILNKDDYIEFIVKDNGKGVDADFLECIFNPGFTTKFDKITGKPSTGIGLCHVKNIVNEYNGQIFVDSKLKKGTKFKIVLQKKYLEGDFIEM